MRGSILILLFLFVVAMAACNSRNQNHLIEGFVQTVLLVGDSILNNSDFVSQPETIAAQLSDKGIYSVGTLAQNRAQIKDVYKQIKKTPQPSSNKPFCIVLSVGGNDILQGHADTKLLAIEYSALVNHILGRFPETKLVLCDVYYPFAPAYRKYDAPIKAWNAWLHTTYEHNSNVTVLPLSTLLGSAEDFTSDIEPSAKGGALICEAIITATHNI